MTKRTSSLGSNTKRTQFNPGVRFNAEEREALNVLQAGARRNDLRMSDSALVRAVLSIATADVELIPLIQLAIKSRETCEFGTSLSIGPAGAEKIARLVEDFTRETGGKEETPSLNDIVRALVVRFTFDLPLLGACRDLVDNERRKRSRNAKRS